MVVRRGGVAGPRGFIFELTGGHLCLDLANTVDNRPTERAVDHVGSFAELVSWGDQAGAVSRDEARRLRARAKRKPARADAALRRAVEVREAIFELFSAMAKGVPAPRRALAVLNAAWPEVMRHQRIAATARRFEWEWATTEDFDRILWSVLSSAAKLLIEGDPALVRECAAANCAWLFLDTSRNRTRRWCDMSVCGNRNKARRHYQRKRVTG